VWIVADWSRRCSRADLGLVKRFVYELLERDPPVLRAARLARAAILALILVSVLGLIVETLERVQAVAGRALFALEVFAIATFTLEYLLRLWVITENPRFAHPVRGRARWVLTPMAIMDFLAIVPFYLPFFTADLRMLRLARIFRLARIARLGRYSSAAKMIADSARERREELTLSAGFIAVLLLVAASLMYYAEHEAQPEVFSSIPAAMWWAIVTLTTVGYGDTFPVTPAGRMLAALTAVFGIAMLALPTAILTSGFMERMEQMRKAKAGSPSAGDGDACPHCGQRLH
jgi:voltage-gated potassium channel